MADKHHQLGVLPPRHNFLGLPDIEHEESIEFINYVSEIWDAVLQFNRALIPGDETNVMIKSSLKGNLYQTTFSGHLLSLEMSSQTLAKLVTLKDEFFRGSNA